MNLMKQFKEAMECEYITVKCEECMHKYTCTKESKISASYNFASYDDYILTWQKTLES